MKINGIQLEILDKIAMRRITFHSSEKDSFLDYSPKTKPHLVKAKNVILSGEFCSTSEHSINDTLVKWNANVQQEMSPDTEVLICGKYPDWMLVEDARHFGIKIVFADKAGEFFSRMASKLITNRYISHNESLAV